MDGSGISRNAVDTLQNPSRGHSKPPAYPPFDDQLTKKWGANTPLEASLRCSEANLARTNFLLCPFCEVRNIRMR
jgi:hypothetical protein